MRQPKSRIIRRNNRISSMPANPANRRMPTTMNTHRLGRYPSRIPFLYHPACQQHSPFPLPFNPVRSTHSIDVKLKDIPTPQNQLSTIPKTRPPLNPPLVQIPNQTPLIVPPPILRLDRERLRHVERPKSDFMMDKRTGLDASTSRPGWDDDFRCERVDPRD